MLKIRVTLNRDDDQPNSLRQNTRWRKVDHLTVMAQVLPDARKKAKGRALMYLEEWY
jgi:hypothetical protein